MNKQSLNVQLNTHHYIGVYHSIPLKEYFNALEGNFKTLSECRLVYLILGHLERYNRSIQSNLLKIYGVTRVFLVKVLKRMVLIGYLRLSSHKVITNIKKHVSYTAYMITPKGKIILKELNLLVDHKLSLITK